MNASTVYHGSDGEVTKAFYAELERRGALGVVALNLFRAQKCSTRAKCYRGGKGGRSFKSMAYDRKGWSLRQLASALDAQGTALGITFGWGRDEKQAFNPWVLYVELPGLGQVSFHSPERYAGPDYAGEWDGLNASEDRIINFCQAVYTEQTEAATVGAGC